MPVSPFFDHVGSASHQGLVEDLIQEAIEQRGVNTHYIRRVDSGDKVGVFNESSITQFSTGVPIEMIIEDISNFNGEGDLFSAFGGFSLEDSVTFKVSGRRFREELGANALPESGDIIYLDFADQAFEVQKRLEDEDYRQLGRNYTFRIKCTKFVFENEEMATGIDELDNLDDIMITPDDLDAQIKQFETPQDVRDDIVDSGVNDTILDFGD